MHQLRPLLGKKVDTYNPEIVEQQSRSEAELLRLVEQSTSYDVHINLTARLGHCNGVSGCLLPIMAEEDIAFLHRLDRQTTTHLTDDKSPDFEADLNRDLEQVAILRCDGVGPCKRL